MSFGSFQGHSENDALDRLACKHIDYQAILCMPTETGTNYIGQLEYLRHLEHVYVSVATAYQPEHISYIEIEVGAKVSDPTRPNSYKKVSFSTFFDASVSSFGYAIAAILSITIN